MVEPCWPRTPPTCKAIQHLYAGVVVREVVVLQRLQTRPGSAASWGCGITAGRRSPLLGRKGASAGSQSPHPHLELSLHGSLTPQPEGRLQLRRLLGPRQGQRVPGFRLLGWPTPQCRQSPPPRPRCSCCCCWPLYCQTAPLAAQPATATKLQPRSCSHVCTKANQTSRCHPLSSAPAAQSRPQITARGARGVEERQVVGGTQTP